MHNSNLSLERKIGNFMFHNQELIQVVMGLLGLLFFLAPFLASGGMISASFLWTEEHGLSKLSEVSIILGAILIALLILFHNLFPTSRSHR